MDSRKSVKTSSSEEKLDEILSTVKKLGNQINNLDYRISLLEGHISQQTPIEVESGESETTGTNVTKHDFDNLDEHLKRTYQTLASEHKPMTASDLAEKMGRSRSTTSYHLNRLQEMGILKKIHGTSKPDSRKVFFQLKDDVLQLKDSKE